MNQDIHPLIQDLNLSEGAKVYFHEQKFHEMIQSPVAVSTANDPVNEATENWWGFSMPNDFEHFLQDNLKVFYGAVIDARSKFLKQHHPGLKMIFYTWYDAMAGNFNFSLVNVKEEKLPFGCNIKMASSLGEIWQEFIEDPHKGLIPWEELKISEPSEETQENPSEENKENFILNVWSVILP